MTATPIPNEPDLYDDPPDEYLDEPPAQQAPTVDLEPDEVVVPKSFTDAHVAEALADALRGQWLYCAAWSTWLRWDGRRWARDTTELIYETARQWAIELVATVARVGSSSDDVKRAAAYRSRAKIDAALTMARRIAGIAADPAEFDRHPGLLTVPNGTVDLRTGELLTHDPGHRITKIAGGAYRPGARHADVDAVLAVVTPQVRDYLQVVFGYGATGHTHEALVPVFDGGGGNGKSTLLEAVSAALGDHAGPVSPRLVMKGHHEAHPTTLAALQGLRLATLVETEEGGSLRLEQVKAITGGDTITARYLYGDFFAFEPSHLLVIATNHRPLVNSTEPAAWRRLRLVRFPYTYRPAAEVDEATGDRPIDPWLMHRVRTDKPALDAMLSWIIDGARRWYLDGIPACPEVDEATNAWRHDEDAIARFIDERLELDPAGELRGSELYGIYKAWCTDEGRTPRSNKNFAAELLAHPAAGGIEKVSRQRVAFYKGVTSRGEA